MGLLINSVICLTAVQTTAGKGALAYDEVIKAVEKNLNVEELQADLQIEFAKGGGTSKTWKAKLYSWVEGQTNWKVAKFYGGRENGNIIRKKNEQFSQKNGEMPYFPLGAGAADVGIFNTDYSFRDILEISKLSSDYQQVTFEEVPFNESSCYHIVMKAKSKKTFYDKREMWVDKEMLYPLKMNVFGSTGQNLKTIEIKKTQLFRGANLPVEFVVTSGTRATTTRITLINVVEVNKNKVNEFKE